MLVLISHKDDDIGEGDECIIGFVEFVIPCEHSTKLLDITKVTFDNIPALVQLFVILPRLRSIVLRRNHRHHSALHHLRSTGITLIRLVHRQRFALAYRLRNLLQQLLSFGIVRRRTRRQTTNDRQGLIRNNGVEFAA